MNSGVLEQLKATAKEIMTNSLDSSHDFDHVIRVFNLALTISRNEFGVNLTILQAAALLHDIGMPEELSDPSGQTDHAIVSAKLAAPILHKLGFKKYEVEHIQACIVSHRYKTNSQPQTIEAKILFDADKLDSVGAIGIARAYCWIGKNNGLIYKKVDIEEYKNENLSALTSGRIKDKTKHSPQIEFEIKYKHINKKLHSETAKKICQDRIKYFASFLDRLEKEIKGEK